MLQYKYGGTIMSKETYKFSEVLFGLREEYLENEKLLNQLDDYIEITGDDYIDYDFSLGQSIRGYNIVRLDIMKKQSEISRLLEYISFEVFSRMPYSEPFLMVKEGEDGQYFKVDEYLHIKPELHYNVEITDKKAFKEITDEIYNGRLFKQKPVSVTINPFQSMDIDLHRLSLWTSGEVINSNSFGVIAYEPHTDTIHACPNMKRGYHFTLDMFDTQIPACMIPEGFREIIDDNLEKYNIPKNVRLDTEVNKKEELDITQKEKDMVLTKRRKLKFYE